MACLWSVPEVRAGTPLNVEGARWRGASGSVAGFGAWLFFAGRWYQLAGARCPQAGHVARRRARGRPEGFSKREAGLAVSQRDAVNTWKHEALVAKAGL